MYQSLLYASFRAICSFRISFTEDFIVAIRIERRVDVDQIDAGVRQFGKLFEVVAAVDDAGIDEGGRLQSGDSLGPAVWSVK